MSAKVEALLNLLANRDRPLKLRFRALFALRNESNPKFVSQIMQGLRKVLFEDASDLLKHEIAFCLGQMGNLEAIGILQETLKSEEQATIVRHEAAEALGALGREEDIDLLKTYRDNPQMATEIRETCHLAIKRIQFFANNSEEAKNFPANPYTSVDPAPPLNETNVDKLKALLLDEKADLFDRYRAMFSLRNEGSIEAIRALAEGLKCGSSVLFRHEIAYVLGQMQSSEANTCLIETLRNDKENEIVRHECAEALGSIASSQIVNVELSKYLDKSQPRVLRESCEVALDMCDYENSKELVFVLE